MDKRIEQQLAASAIGDGLVVRVWSYEDAIPEAFVSISRVDEFGEYSSLTVSARTLVDVVDSGIKTMSGFRAKKSLPSSPSKSWKHLQE